jgi:hypothetical protein
MLRIGRALSVTTRLTRDCFNLTADNGRRASQESVQIYEAQALGIDIKAEQPDRSSWFATAPTSQLTACS